MSLLLEVCAFNIQSCLLAQKLGAARVELCDNPAEGGTTPSYGCIRETRDRVHIDLYPIIRPRAGSYCYDEAEWSIMQRDVLMCKELGCDGISVGVQLTDGRLDTERMRRLVELAYPMGVTCNRVFDAVPDPREALEQLVAIGCERVLSSGQASSAPEGAHLLAELVQQAGGRIIIMPGAGIRAANLQSLAEQTGATEFHSSARKTVADNVAFRNPKILDIGSWVMADENELTHMLQIMQKASTAE